MNLSAIAGDVDVDAGSIAAGVVSATDGDVRLLASGAITTAGVSAKRPGGVGGAIDIDSTGGGALNLGNVTADLGITLDTLGSITAGVTTARGGALTVGGAGSTGAVTFTGNVRANSVAIDTTGALTAEDMTATAGGITIDAESIAAGALVAIGGGIDLQAVGDISASLLRTSGAIDVDSTGTGLAAGDLMLGDLIAGAGITLDASGTIAAGAIRSTGGTLAIGGDLTPASVSLSGDARALSIAINTSGALTAQALTATAGGIDVDAGSIAAGGLSASGGGVNLLTVGAIDTASINASGAINVESTGGGALDLGPLTSGMGITLDTTGSIETAAISAVDALVVGGVREPGTVLFTGDARAQSITIDAVGSVTTQALTATGGAIDIDAGSIAAQAVMATGGGVNLLSAGFVDTASINASGAINVDSTGGGALDLGPLTSGMGITLDTTGSIETAAISAVGALVVGGEREPGSVLFTGYATAQSITIDAVGSVTTQGLTATGGAIDVDAGSITATGALSASGGDVRLLATGGIATGAITATRVGMAGGAIDVDSTGGGALDLGALIASTGITLDTTGSIETAAISADGDLAVGVDRQAASVTFTGDAQAANVTVDTAGLFTAEGISAGDGAIAINAGDVALNTQGTGISAASVTFTSDDNGSIGLGTGDGDMSLSDDELDLITTDSLMINAGSGAIRIAGASFTADAGSSTVTIATTGTIAIDGDLSGAGTGRVFRVGGSDDGTVASQRITANIDMATIDLGTNTLDLRARNIVFGQQALIDDVEGLSIKDLVTEFVANAESLLYNPENLSAARLANPTYLKAGKLNVTYGGSALFQNAAPRTGGGSFAGVELAGGDTSTPTLTLSPIDAPSSNATNATNAFALFGSIDGFEGPAASLAGEAVISVDDEKILFDASRVNGCVIGSGADCVTTIVGNFVLSVPREVVSLITAEDRLLVPFDPLVGTNNEGLFSDAATTAPDDKECKQRDANGACVSY